MPHAACSEDVRPPELDEKKVVATVFLYQTTWWAVSATAAVDAAASCSIGPYTWLRVSA